jgi:iron(III) transport system substrate-binding protein
MIGGARSVAARAGAGMYAVLALAVNGCDGDRPPPEGAAETPEAAVVVWVMAPDFPLNAVAAAFTKATGVPVEIVSGGDSPPARTDLVLAADTGALWRLNDDSGLRPLYSDVLEANVPAALRDRDSMWFGLEWRPLVIAHDPGEVDATALPAYSALAAERWRGRLCLSTSRLAANRALLASLIAQLGEPAAERIVRGFVANLAAGPFASANELLAAIADDRCDIGIVAADVLAAMPIENDAVATAVPGEVFAIVTAAGVTRHATHPDGAAALLEWLSTEAAQAIVAAESLALPVNPRVAANPRMDVTGPFPPGPLAVAQSAARFGAAALLAERARYE